MDRSVTNAAWFCTTNAAWLYTPSSSRDGKVHRFLKRRVNGQSCVACCRAQALQLSVVTVLFLSTKVTDSLADMHCQMLSGRCSIPTRPLLRTAGPCRCRGCIH